MPDVAEVNVSCYTVSRRLREFGLYERVAVHQIDITQAHAQQRLLFAQLLAHHPREHFDSYIFSDEKSFGFVHFSNVM